MSDGAVLAATRWRTNAEMIADVARLGYLRKEWVTLDPTFGRGTWWKVWRPEQLVTHDLRLDGVDFRALPYTAGCFDAVAFDPPYKLNGTPSDPDERYGVDAVATWRDRHQLIRDGIAECLRVLRVGGILLVKCQDQVNSGHVRWQTREFADHAEGCGAVLVDRFDHLTNGRPQPPRSRADGKPSVQQHARRNVSTLLVLRRQAG